MVVVNKICLGTANFGLQYGQLENKIDPVDIKLILNEAEHLGICHLDTAQGYGDSENSIAPYASDFRIITKISAKNLKNRSELSQSLLRSLARLDLPNIDSVLMHDTAEALQHRTPIFDFVESMQDAVRQGLIKSFGFSVYNEEEIVALMRLNVPLYVLQVPENILDGRLYRSTLIQNLSNQGCKIFVRSLFLQGLILNPRLAQKYTQEITMTKYLNRFSQICHKYEISKLHAALGYFNAIEWADFAVIGCDSVIQLQEIFETIKIAKLPVGFLDELFDNAPRELIDPRTWEKIIR